jgi:hypothetical protein
MSAANALSLARIQEHCRGLHLPTVAEQCERLAEEARREQHSPLDYLAELLGAEVDERERRTIERRLKEARLPRLKTLETFDFNASPQLSAAYLQELTRGGYLGSCRTDYPHRRCRYRKNPFGYRAVRRGLSPEKAGTLCYRGRSGQ